LQKDQRLPELLMTPSTKGILKGIAGVPEGDDVNITRQDILNNYAAFNFSAAADVDQYEKLLSDGFSVISKALSAIDQVFVDTKFEFGYVDDQQGRQQLIYMDEVGTPDSSRIWDAAAYRKGQIVEQSKEAFRQFLLNYFPDPDILLNKERMPERIALARDNALPLEAMMKVSETYLSMAAKITGQHIRLPENPKAEIVEILRSRYGLIDQ
jgi:phosphoribosylaminoimidazole-succinocarboxamide synthase